MSGKWTPGPWCTSSTRVLAAEFPDGFISTPEHPDYVIAQCGCFTSPGMCQANANAHLIAAAPDLYEALQQIMGSPCGMPPEFESAAFKALAKARGER